MKRGLCLLIIFCELEIELPVNYSEIKGQLIYMLSNLNKGQGRGELNKGLSFEIKDGWQSYHRHLSK